MPKPDDAVKISKIIDEINSLSLKDRELLGEMLFSTEHTSHRLVEYKKPKNGDAFKGLIVLSKCNFLAYSPEEFSEKIGRPAGTVRRWLREGTLKGKQINRSWLIPHSELERLTSTD